MITASELADAIGRKKMADSLNVGVTAISNAVVRKSYPSSWFLVVRDLARQAGVDCPPELFKMRMADDTPDVDIVPQLQGQTVEKANGGAA